MCYNDRIENNWLGDAETSPAVVRNLLFKEVPDVKEHTTNLATPVKGEAEITREQKRCPSCTDLLYKKEVVNVKTGEPMGHYWWCYLHERGYVGWGDPDEHDGKSKSTNAKQEAAQ